MSKAKDLIEMVLEGTNAKAALYEAAKYHKSTYLKTHNDPNSEFNKSVRAIQANQPKWDTLEGQLILRVPGSNFAAIPANGKKNSAKFVVFDVNTREEITFLTKKEVFGWLAKRAIS